MLERREDTETLNLNVGARVHCEDGRCGKLHKVVVNPEDNRVTDLVIEKGWLQRQDRILPVSTVKDTTGQDIHLTVDIDELERYPKYRQVEFKAPRPGYKSGPRSSDRMKTVQTPYGTVTQENLVPMIKRRVHEGVPSNLEVIERGTPVRTVEGEIGAVDHVLVDRDEGKITHIIMRQGLLPEYRIVPIEQVDYISDESVVLSVKEKDTDDLPRYQPRSESTVLSELRNQLAGSSFDLEDVKARLQNGVARLTGVVQDAAAKKEAGEIALSIQDIIKVENLLDTDEAIEDEVVTALSSDPRTAEAEIEVESADGTVTLRGTVEDGDVRKAAEKLATKQEGVREVKNELEREREKASAL